jgi:hypothetical protein
MSGLIELVAQPFYQKTGWTGSLGEFELVERGVIGRCIARFLGLIHDTKQGLQVEIDGLLMLLNIEDHA